MTMQQIDVEKRLDTGPLKIGGDWPGVFIRGDEAIAFAQGLQSHTKDNAVLRELRNVLMSCFNR